MLWASRETNTGCNLLPTVPVSVFFSGPGRLSPLDRRHCVPSTTQTQFQVYGFIHPISPGVPVSQMRKLRPLARVTAPEDPRSLSSHSWPCDHQERCRVRTEPEAWSPGPEASGTEHLLQKKGQAPRVPMRLWLPGSAGARKRVTRVSSLHRPQGGAGPLCSSPADCWGHPLQRS